jgi:hypothetical protein
MAQAVGAQALLRVGREGAARQAFNAIPGPLVQRIDKGPWIRLYSFNNLVVLNAQLQAVLSLRDYAERSGSKRAARFAGRLAQAAKAKLPAFDTGYWSLYSLARESPLLYHRYVVEMLGRLAQRTGETFWQDAHDRFDGYTGESPRLRRGVAQPRFYPWPVDGFRDRVAIGFWLSKISDVTIRVGGDTLKLGTLPGGWHRVWWKTGKRDPRTFTPAVDAVDLAGNGGSAPLAPIVLARDETPPDVDATVKKRRLTWKARDGETPWVALRLRLTRAGVQKVVQLGRHPLAGSLVLSPPRGTWEAALVVLDSSGNRTTVPLGKIPRAK